MLVLRLIRTGDQHLGVGILYRKQGRHFALEGLLFGYAVRDLDVELLAPPDCDEVNLLLGLA